jgi:osmotically inducible lipoprotein OsmB
MLKLVSPPRSLMILTAMTSILVLSGCGTDPGDRAVSGAAIGAGAGAIIGAATGTAATGAAIGALGGAAIGAATDPCDLNLGDPYWRDHGGRDEYDRRCHRDRYHDRYRD